MIGAIARKLFGSSNERRIKSYLPRVAQINALEKELEALSDEALRARTETFKQQVADGASLDDILVPAFATCREAAKRTLGQRHFDVQLVGGMILHEGRIAEMKTGEGKTLVATLPVYLNALSGRGVHVVTVNDYLAKRDSEWMGQVYNFLGLKVGVIVHGLDDEQRKIAYDADVTYGTNNELGFDYLRDNMKYRMELMTQRGHIFAIVDEVDSILIDEARTPLIISGPADEAAQLYYQFASIARTLTRDVDYEVDEEKKTVVPLESGIEKVEKAVGVDNIYDAVSTNYVHQLTKALTAKDLYKRDKDYLVAGGEVKIIDEFTGRTLDGRRWSDGLHQAVEAKERVRIKEENHTWATVTLQNYFRLYAKLSGMTGTAETEASEFANTYELPVVPIPPNKPLIREDNPDLIYKSEEAKFAAVVDDLADRHAAGQPVLVGTASVSKSEHLSRLLEKKGIPHEVLNAKQHFREAEIVAQAGRVGGVTVATNMAGRGVDIILGGNPEGLAAREAQPRGIDPTSEEGQAALVELQSEFDETCRREGEEVRASGGLYVLGSERHESRRIDNQLRGRSGRQGDPGESRFFLSLEDDLMRLFATGAMNWVMGRALPDDVPIEAKMVTKAIERAQNTVEGRNAESRKDVLKYDDVMNEQRKVIYRRRNQIIDGEDLREETVELLESTMTAVVASSCPSDYPEEWDLPRLVTEITQYYPTKFVADDLAGATTVGQVTESILTEALDLYAERDETIPGGEEIARQLERDIMLQIIDQRWQDHLAEMDYLREGINLRAMGNQDPLVAYQREGFAMFGKLMDGIGDDYLRYVFHVQVITEPAPEPNLVRANYLAADDPVQGDGAITAAFAAATPAQLEEAAAAVGLPGGNGAQAGVTNRLSEDGESQVPIVKSEREKIGRNEPCWCGSAKKYKFCHG